MAFEASARTREIQVSEGAEGHYCVHFKPRAGFPRTGQPRLDAEAIARLLTGHLPDQNLDKMSKVIVSIRICNKVRDIV